MDSANIWLAIQHDLTTIAKLVDGITRMEFTGRPPIIDRPVFLIGDDGERITKAPEGRHLLENGKAAIIDGNGMLVGVEDNAKLKTVELIGHINANNFKSLMDPFGYYGISTTLEKELFRLSSKWIAHPKTMEERIHNVVVEARIIQQLQSMG